VSVQFYFRNTDKCSRFPVVFDWWSGNVLIGNETTFIRNCSIFDNTAMDYKNGRTFFYSQQGPQIYTFSHRGENGRVQTPTLINVAQTLFLERPSGMVYHSKRDQLIFVDNWATPVLYSLDYNTGIMTNLMNCFSCFQWACTSALLLNDDYFCTWTYLWQFNIVSQEIQKHQLYPPLVKESTFWEQALSVGDRMNRIYYIYFNPSTKSWANFFFNTSDWTIHPFDSNPDIFGGTSSDQMNAVALYSMEGDIFVSVVRGGGNSYHPIFLKLYKLTGDRLELNATSSVIQSISTNTINSNGDFMFDHKTLSG